jgi:murein DD-endopeptidase MepM/ murein hydrolase activator NlpD
VAANVPGKKYWVFAGVIIALVIIRKLGFWLTTFKSYSPITLYNGKQTARGCDKGGCGKWGAPRTRADGIGKHEGQDILCTVGSNVMAPYDGVIERLSVPYPDDARYSGVVLRVNAALIIKIMYMQPASGIVGQKVSAGQVIGICQNISIKYGTNVPPHLHVEVHEWGVKVNPEPYIFKT